MVVRERRRIASLAKTASALDEKLQELQMDIEAKEVAFRSYVQDSQQDLATISMNHQEQILSLMSLVKGEGDPDLSKIDEMTAASGNESIGLDLKESSNLLFLANERIAVLEQQLGELKAEMKVSETYRQEKAEARAALETKTEEYERLELRFAGQRATLRQIRDLLTNDKRDDNDLSSPAKDGVHRTCLAIIREALRDSPGPMSPMARRHSCPNIAVLQADSLSPRSRKRWEFVQGADDDVGEDEEDETPEWADEIMADLAIIAEGRLPPSLQNVPEIMDTQALEETRSVFDRLASPGSYTGIQKQRISLGDNIDASTEGGTKGPAIIKSVASSWNAESAVANNSKKGSPSRAKNGTRSGSENHRTTSIDDDFAASSLLKCEDLTKPNVSETGATVFDRLVNPTNFTGTQKEKHHAQTGAQKERQESAAERMLDHLLQSDADLFNGRQDDDKEKGENFHSRVDEYIQKNVFERLQKTTTHSFAVKHAPAPDQPDLQQEQNPSHILLPQKLDVAKGAKVALDSKPKRNSAPLGDRSTGATYKSPPRSHLRQGASSNRAAHHRSPAKRTEQSPARIKTPPRTRSPSRTRIEGYTQQNVFERLTKTTTEAYAIKKRVVKN